MDELIGNGDTNNINVTTLGSNFDYYSSVSIARAQTKYAAYHRLIVAIRSTYLKIE